MSQFFNFAPASPPSSAVDLTTLTPTTGSPYAYVSAGTSSGAVFEVNTNNLVFGTVGSGSGTVLAISPTDPGSADYTASLVVIGFNYVAGTGNFIGQVFRGSLSASRGYAVGVKVVTDDGSGTITGNLGCWDMADPTLSTAFGTPVAVSFSGGSPGNPGAANHTVGGGVLGNVITGSYAGQNFTFTDSANTYTTKGNLGVFYSGGGSNFNSGWVFLSQTASSTVTSSAPSPGTLAILNAAPGQIVFTISTDSAGTAPYSNQLKRSAHGANNYTPIGSPASSNGWPGILTPLSDISGTPGQSYDYQVVVTDSASGTATSNTITITWPNDTAGVVTLIGTSPTSANLSATEASGGTSPFTHQWYRSNANGSQNNPLSGQTGLILSDTGLTPATTYHYFLSYTDSSNPPVSVPSVTLVVTTPSNLAAGLATAGSVTSSTSAATATEATGGTGPYAHQWYRSTASGTLGTAVSGQTTLNLADSGLLAATSYFYTLKYTDSESTPAVVSSNQVTLTTSASSGGSSPVTLDQLNAALAAAFAAHDPWATLLPASYPSGSAGALQSSSNLGSILGHAAVVDSNNLLSVNGADFNGIPYNQICYDGQFQVGTSATQAVFSNAFSAVDGAYNGFALNVGIGPTLAYTVIENYVGSTRTASWTTPVSPAFASGQYFIFGFPSSSSSSSSGADPLASLVPGTYGTGTAGYALGKLDATISSRSTYTGGPVASVTAPVTVGTNNDKTGYALSSSGLDSIVIEVGVNARQALSPILAFACGLLSGAGTGNISIYAGANPSTKRIGAVTDASGNRTSVTLFLPT